MHLRTESLLQNFKHLVQTLFVRKRLSNALVFPLDKLSIDLSKHSINFLKRSRKRFTNTYETSYFRQDRIMLYERESLAVT